LSIKAWKDLWNNRGIRFRDEDASVLDGFDQEPFRFDKDLIEEVVSKIRMRLRLEAKHSLLEVGCGAGMLLKPLSSFCSHVGGVDFAASLIERIKRDIPEGEFYCCEANCLPFAAASFDRVLIHSVFQYFPVFSYAQQVLDETWRVLKPGGLALIADLPDKIKRREAQRFKRHVSGGSTWRKVWDLIKCDFLGLKNGLSHIYYSKDFFVAYSQRRGAAIEIYDQDISRYGNSPYRFNVLLSKPD